METAQSPKKTTPFAGLALALCAAPPRADCPLGARSVRRLSAAVGAIASARALKQGH